VRGVGGGVGVAERPAVVVVGGGVGGLATSIRLRAAGHRVTVLERRPEVGGKLTVHQRDGFSFDIGPSLVTLPHLFDEVLALAGTRLADRVDLVRLDPQFHYRWPDGVEMTVHDDPAATRAAWDRVVPGAGTAWQRLVDHGRRIWDVSERTFFAGPMEHPLALMRRMRSPRDLVDIDPLRSVHRVARRTLDDPRFVQWAGRYATYSGSSPYRAPATLACIPYLETRYGAWYPMGGLGRLRDTLADVAQEVGVQVETGVEVHRIRTVGDAVAGVITSDDRHVDAPLVIANVDAEHLYRDLLPDTRALRRVQRGERSSSGVVVMAGVRGRTPGQGHHTIWFSPDDRAEFADLEAGRLHATPTIYGCVTSVTDPSQAPQGHESWFLLVNVPAGVEVDAEAYREVVLEQLARRGTDLRDRLVFTEMLTPAELASRYRSPGGAIYGTSSNGRRAAFLRPGNRGPRRGLYLVGGSSHPGGGLPLVLTSARIVADAVAEDGW
jgi:phytoene desaturase